MVADSWFRSLWRTPWKQGAGQEKVLVGVLAFEVSSLMSKLVHLWQSLSDKQVARLREEITNSVGIKKLVSDDEDFIVSLVCAEMIENMARVAKSVVRLAKKCNDPGLKSFKIVFEDLINKGADPYGWEFTWKKMDRKVKKMERLISVNANLYQEMELLSDLEQTLRRMKENGDTEGVNLLEFQKKVVWKKHEVKNLREISLWNRACDYTVRLLARSLFTIFGRIKHVFGIQQMVDVEIKDSGAMNPDIFHRSESVSALLQPSVNSSKNSLPRFSSGPLGKLFTKSGPVTKKNKTSNIFSGPLGGSTTKSGPIARKNSNVNFYSGPLGRSTTKSGPILGMNKANKKEYLKSNRLTQVGPFKGCMVAGNNSPVTNFYIRSNVLHAGILNGTKDRSTKLLAPGNIHDSNPSIIDSNCKLLNAPPDTLGAAALALHYANVIIVIERLVASPHLIGHDARDDLYNMLPASVRAALRASLKPYAKIMASPLYDMDLAGEWTEAMTGILEWLAPLAHNMIRWQSERSYEQQNFGSRTHVLLVQTLFFANQEKTEAIITELLVGLNYIWRFGREVDTKALHECASSRILGEYLDLEG